MTTQTLVHLFLSALFTTVKSGNNLCPPAELTNKSGICPHKGILFGNKKDEVLTQATTWTSLENTMGGNVCSPKSDSEASLHLQHALHHPPHQEGERQQATWGRPAS